MKKILIIAVFSFTAMSFTTSYNENTSKSIEDFPSDVCSDAAWAIDDACGGLTYDQFDSYYTKCLTW